MIARLAHAWDSGGMLEYVLVVPHIFYLPVLRLFLDHVRRNAPEVSRHICLFFDYAYLNEMHELAQLCFSGERGQVLKFLDESHTPCIDCGRHLLLENLISLACYMIPARYLVFVDDDFLLRDSAAIETLLQPLQCGYMLSGIFVRPVKRIHTCLFAINPDYLRAHLRLFDQGRNLYDDTSLSTGSITYQMLAKRNKGVFPVADHERGYEFLGRHLGHCTGEVWGDLPLALRAILPPEALPAELGAVRFDAGLLLESLANAFRVKARGRDYELISSEVRRNAGRDFPTYLDKVYNNHHWLISQTLASAGVAVA